ncbi:dephospho-CoA kinase [Phytoactinopolyspora limicola]|uniref:dephospho-CoA kinase n=1 Tax=Phytoactinopolyspora limicola TaxID=2715536 RepID=UPI001409DF90|nr:dephospho-CoA kinase [Phytoactinopolyspora limicola]
MLRVGLTGGIGSGKSTVATKLVELGAVLIDADRLAREVVAPGTPGLDEVVGEFGREVLADDGSLDRAELARIIFADDERRAALNAIVHPRVHERRTELVAAAPSDAIVVEDIPLLVENGLVAAYPAVIVVHAPVDTRIERLVARGLSAADAQTRIDAQASDDARRAAADVWLDNTGSVDVLSTQVAALWAQRLVPFEGNVRARRAAERSGQPVIVDADPAWTSDAARITARIRNVAGDDAQRIDHIGSTSVPGLAAKDVIDVQVVVDDLEQAASVADRLIDVGFARLPGRWFDTARDGAEVDKVMAGNADPDRAVNVHIRHADSPTWRHAVMFRDWLRAQPRAVAEYAALKRKLAGDTYETMDDYAVRKTPWINAALSRADEWARDTGWRLEPS